MQPRSQPPKIDEVKSSVVRISVKNWAEFVSEFSKQYLNLNCQGSKYLKVNKMLTPMIDASASEYWLFHGCSKQTVCKLTHEGYDPRVSNLDGMFGGGFYLAANSSKSNQYIMCPNCKRNSIFTGIRCKCRNQEEMEFQILIYRALLGDLHIVVDYDPKKYRGKGKDRIRRAPIKANNNNVYDSVLAEKQKYGGNKLKYREIILYESYQAYPEYVVTFKRSAANVRVPACGDDLLNKCYDFLTNRAE
ncbi:unnamed protein product [Didymodactylos carnosus]|uniref:PARP catalytic domain-containing protein n=1 Tax=Didymodactylos carnosus TaxID=1234261 RepID=A0A816B4P7_9BILA|nr:unnamed protein product [Didymodactylos carnosus]CAF1604129.1 unnamed protein product [Didymodactylos carnosus]CAF3763570.1 unnamed protein product [Didymodactylos carnosus]CAF4483041.1 unnamed protein product [Didymodactylos carnosus]